MNPTKVPGWRNGRRSGFKIRRQQWRGGSSPFPGTTYQTRTVKPSFVERLFWFWNDVYFVYMEMNTN